MTDPAISVTQADRDAAAERYKEWRKPVSERCARDGSNDCDDLVQAFARHRLASTLPTPPMLMTQEWLDRCVETDPVAECEARPTPEPTGEVGELIEAVAKVLYDCEKARSDNADEIMSLAAGRPISMHMEPYAECQAMYRLDARAVLSVIPGADTLATMQERVGVLEGALERCAQIVERNLYHQHEKVEDVPRIARSALTPYVTEEGRVDD